MKRLYIIHRWDGTPSADWYVWLKKFAEKLNFQVEILKMPHPKIPTIGSWTDTLRKNIKLDKETYLIGHSIGNQTILRFLANEESKIGGVFLVAPWVKLKNISFLEKIIARPWLTKKVGWQKARAATENYVAVFSDDDPSVSMENAEVFAEKLDAKIIKVKNKGHLTAREGVRDLEF
ncbi:alpha/beta hydrolase, partial [Candidatus Saccharibacteria bacterium]|nr:alpha/beta hydrolase [Candidatus Saccharibacteria bacterium]